MPRPPRPWFRFYVEAMADRKLRRLKPEQRWLWAGVLAAARQSPTPGVLLDGVADVPMTDRDIADYAGVPVRLVAQTMPEFERAEMVSRDGSGAWRVTNWGRRQPESDDVTARTQKHRSRERGRNVPMSFPGTPKERPRERSPSRALATESETEISLSSSNGLTTRPDPPDDDDQAQLASSLPGQHPDQDRHLPEQAEEALAILAKRDLDDRQRNPRLAPISDVRSWLNRATDRRRQRHHEALLAAAATDPQAGPEQLAEHIAPPPTSPPPDRADRHPLAGQANAQRALAEAGQAAVRALAAEPPDPQRVDRVAELKTRLRLGHHDPNDAA